MKKVIEMSLDDYLDLAYARKRYIAEHKDEEHITPVLMRTEFGEWVYPDEEAENEEGD
jgi:hypothetical protein